MDNFSLHICCFLFLIVACKPIDNNVQHTTEHNDGPAASVNTIPSDLIIGKWSLYEVKINRVDTTEGRLLRDGKSIYSVLKDSFPSFIFNDRYQLFYDGVCIGNWKAEEYSIFFTDKDSLHQSPVHFNGRYNVEVHSKYRMKLDKVYHSHKEDKMKVTYFLRRVRDSKVALSN